MSGTKGTAKRRRPASRPARHQLWSPSQKTVVNTYVQNLADILDLNGWEIEIDWKHVAHEDADAQVSPVEGRRYAVIELGRTFAKLSLAEQRRVLIHELLHLHTHTLCHSVHKSLEESTGSGLYLPTFDLLEETLVDTLAVAVARMAPMPPWDPKPPIDQAVAAKFAKKNRRTNKRGRNPGSANRSVESSDSQNIAGKEHAQVSGPPDFALADVPGLGGAGKA